MIRRARPSEATEVASVLIRSRRSEVGIPPAVHSDDEVRRWVCEVLMDQTEVWVVTGAAAPHADKPTAVMALHDHWIDQLYVLPEHQGAGHGRQLVAHAQRRHDALALWTFASNQRAQRFYESLGFRQSGPVSSDNEENAPALCYRWSRR